MAKSCQFILHLLLASYPDGQTRKPCRSTLIINDTFERPKCLNVTFNSSDHLTWSVQYHRIQDHVAKLRYAQVK
ncbi:hypothetical protein EV401DRAFT_612487 [Pisolithus croceorrhizus]|nr:hypothetical protein EV401DRAFT_612487 [Pisolithus croceorrhizus]